MTLARCRIQGCNSPLIISIMRSPFRSDGRCAPEMIVTRCAVGHYDMMFSVLLDTEPLMLTDYGAVEDGDDYPPESEMPF